MSDPPVHLDLGQFYEAKDQRQLIDAYDRSASVYDAAMEAYRWQGPKWVVAAVERHLERDAHLLDAGAGTGLMGETLMAAGFKNIEAMDPSEGLLAQAQSKGIYREARCMTLGERLDYADDAFDGVLVVGVFTPGHARPESFDELLRITHPGGFIIFTLRSDRPPDGFLDRQNALESGQRWRLVEAGDEFQSLPDGEPEVHHRVWVYEVI